MQRHLVHQYHFLTELLVGCQPYPTVSPQIYSTFDITEIVKYNKIDFYSIIIYILRRFLGWVFIVISIIHVILVVK